MYIICMFSSHKNLNILDSEFIYLSIMMYNIDICFYKNWMWAECVV